MEYAELDVYPILANDVCPNQKLNDVGIEYRFLNISNKISETLMYCSIFTIFFSFVSFAK